MNSPWHIVRVQHRLAFIIVMLTGGAGIINVHFAGAGAKVQRGTVIYQRSHNQEVARLGNYLLTQIRAFPHNHTQPPMGSGEGWHLDFTNVAPAGRVCFLALHAECPGWCSPQGSQDTAAFIEHLLCSRHHAKSRTFMDYSI